MRILGVETSCDETAAAVIEVNHGYFSVLSTIVASQVKLHAKTGGVVPEVAARAHAEVIIPVIEEALREASDIGDQGSGTIKLKPDIDVIAVTKGPGLITSLLVGVEAARTLSYAWRKSLVAVNHLEGHIYANWLPPIGEWKVKSAKLKVKRFPMLCLIVSGGHTELVLVRAPLDHTVIGSTRDDAAGECFDKVAKMLGLGYPGGPAIAAEAAKCHRLWRGAALGRHKVKSEKGKVELPRPMMDSPDFDFSFAGLKTAALYALQKQKRMTPAIRQAFAHELQEAIVEVLIAKTIRAAKAYNVKEVMIGGGVSANGRLREAFARAMEKALPGIACLFPQLEFTGDNAAMIATAGYFYAQKKKFTPWEQIDADPNMAL
ncbi:MAG: tRNA (adenosine(37)-N6)-threonylcarbamoyltransferase complex transferase subunit TsaD [Patescibacteria group bacterium]